MEQKFPQEYGAMENKRREKFVELANKRVNRVLKDLDLVGNLSNRSSYQYSAEDIKQIFGAIRREVNLCQSRFERASKTGYKDRFTLRTDTEFFNGQ